MHLKMLSAKWQPFFSWLHNAERMIVARWDWEHNNMLPGPDDIFIPLGWPFLAMYIFAVKVMSLSKGGLLIYINKLYILPAWWQCYIEVFHQCLPTGSVPFDWWLSIGVSFWIFVWGIFWLIWSFIIKIFSAQCNQYLAFVEGWKSLLNGCAGQVREGVDIWSDDEICWISSVFLNYVIWSIDVI